MVQSDAVKVFGDGDAKLKLFSEMFLRVSYSGTARHN